MAPRAVLVGAPGAGKTTVGVAVADRLGVPFADTDTLVEQHAGRRVPEIFAVEGEGAFRARERTVIAAALDGHDGILALGGGAVLHDGTRRRLRGHTVVHLTVGLPAAVERIGSGAGRPLLPADPHAALAGLLAARAPLYAEVATLTVVTDGRLPSEVADEVAALLTAREG